MTGSKRRGRSATARPRIVDGPAGEEHHRHSRPRATLGIRRRAYDHREDRLRRPHLLGDSEKDDAHGHQGQQSRPDDRRTEILQMDPSHENLMTFRVAMFLDTSESIPDPDGCTEPPVRYRKGVTSSD
ncbi:MAG: hypothetical protein H6Q82_559 [Deltaproteobacteria bacterium]|nr:hypothetical protein [Deltaproteobacteria bacterium]